MIPFKELSETVKSHRVYKAAGKVSQVIGLTVEVKAIQAFVGEICRIRLQNGSFIQAEVVGFKGDSVILMPLGDLAGIMTGCLVYPTGKSLRVPVGPDMLGSVLDGLGRPMDGSRLKAGAEADISRDAPNPLTRSRIDSILSTGVKAIDGFLTCGQGQRIGVFAGSGVGKSTLLGMISRYSSADVNVIALIGERGREVRDFIEQDLGPEGLARSVLVCATSDQPPLIRLKGAFVATAIAEYFRDQGLNVMFMMDSVTRFAMAQREVGLAAGEPPATRGYTPSVFAMLPRLLERSGTGETGSITAFYTVLVEGDDMNEPIADAVRGILDGHIVLSRELAARNHYPAIDVSGSVSRLMNQLVPDEHRDLAGELRNLLGVYRGAEDLINVGAYRNGTSPEIDRALKLKPRIDAFLKQSMYDHYNYTETLELLRTLADTENEVSSG